MTTTATALFKGISFLRIRHWLPQQSLARACTISAPSSVTKSHAALHRHAQLLPAASPMAGPQRPLPGCPRGLSLSGPTPVSAPPPPDSCGKGRQGPCPQGQAALPWPQQHDSGRATDPAPHNLPRTIQPLLTARPPKLSSAVTSMTGLSPTSPDGNAGLGISPEGTEYAVLATARAARRAVTAREGRRARARSPSLPHHRIQCRQEASVRRRRARTLAPSGSEVDGGDALFPLATAAESSPPSASEAVLRAPDNPGEMNSPPHPAFRTSANNRLPPRTAAHRPFAVAAAPGPPRWASWSSLAGCPRDPSRAAGWVRAPVREMRARWLTISWRGWPRIGL